MKFVIVGFGRVGMRTARTLWDEGHEVVVIERDRERADRAKNEDFAVIEGDGSDEQVLDQAGLEDTDAIAGLTSDINANFSACVVGEAHGCRTVLRVDEEFSGDLYEKYTGDVDEVIYPERLGALVAKNALVGGNIRAIADVEQNLQLVELTITESSPMKGYTLSELELPARTRLLAFGKEGARLMLPTADETLDLGDHLVVLSDSEKLDDVRSLIVGETGRAAARGA